MNHIQAISRRIMTTRLRSRLGIARSADVDPLTLRVMWKKFEHARDQESTAQRFRPHLDDSESAFRLYSTE